MNSGYILWINYELFICSSVVYPFYKMLLIDVSFQSDVQLTAQLDRLKREHSGPKQQAVPPATLATFPLCGPKLEMFLLGTISVVLQGRPDTSLKSYSQCGWAVVDQAVQYTQQVVFPVQITEPLLHNTGKRVVLEVLQREDALSLEKRKC